MKVVIDGVTYVPATEAVTGLSELLNGLALQYHTPETLAEYGFRDIRVSVGEMEDGEGESFDELAARLAGLAREKEGGG